MSGEKLVEAARKVSRVKAWSPSRLIKHKDCPQRVLIEDLMKLCPVCFTGRVSGGFDGEPIKCDTCVKKQPEREALDRGTRFDDALTAVLAGATPDDVMKRDGMGLTKDEALVVRTAHVETLAEATRHPFVAKLVKTLRKAKAHAQYRIAFGSDWQAMAEDPDRGIWPRGVWGRVILDALRLYPKKAEVTDWKSGNIDKNKGEIREKPEYQDSMLAYQIATLSTLPKLQEVSATMVFLDAPPKLKNPTKSLPVLKRKDLTKAQKDFEAKLMPLMNDTIFAPRPSYACTWCPWQKVKGGPCRF